MVYLLFGLLISFSLFYCLEKIDKYDVYKAMESAGLSREEYRKSYRVVSDKYQKHPFLIFGLCVITSPIILCWIIFEDLFFKQHKKGK